MSPVWEKIPDTCVQSVWKKAEDDDCGQGPETVTLPPTWYEENGTPICQCGQDMVYSHTAVRAPADEVLEKIRDLLFLDVDSDGVERYNRDKECDSDIMGAVINCVAEHFNMFETK